MAFYFQKPYGPEIEQQLRQYYQSLSEKDRRRFAAVEAIKLGHGGTRYIAKILGCDPQTVKDGMRELKQLPDDPAGSRVRKPGGGRKKTEVKHADLTHQVQETIKNRTAGDPMRQNVLWTDLTPQEIAKSLQEQSVCAAPRIVRRILDGLGLARRQIAKVLPGGDAPHRDAQFRHLGHLIQELLAAGNPVLSIDTKKKECLGTLYRDGKVSCQQALKAFDHDVPSLASGVVNDLAVPIRVAHDPAYCSKFNPIERRLFSHVTRACQGVLFDSLHTVLGLMQKTKPQQGLSVTVRVLNTVYEGGRTVSEAFKKNMPIVFEKLLPKWNYWALPQ